MPLSPAGAVLHECAKRGVKVSMQGESIALCGPRSDVDELTPRVECCATEVTELLTQWVFAMPPPTLRELH